MKVINRLSLFVLVILLSSSVLSAQGSGNSIGLGLGEAG